MALSDGDADHSRFVGQPERLPIRTRYPAIVCPAHGAHGEQPAHMDKAHICTYVPDYDRMAVPLNLPLTCSTVLGFIFENYPLTCGAPLRNRTVDLLLTMETLCRLS
jgi:hypothetical protein